MEAFTPHAEEFEKDGMRLFAVRTNARDVVRIEGSIPGGGNMLPRSKGLVASLTAELLDAGTLLRTKDAIRDGLSARGASVSFSAGGDRLFFSAGCLPEDIFYVFDVITECVSGAVFPTHELALIKERMVAELTESKNDTRSQASGAFSRLIFDTTHVNYAETVPTRIAQIKKITRKDLQTFRKGFGRSGLILSIVGDVKPDRVLKEATKAFERLPKKSYAILPKKPNAKKHEADADLVTIRDKANVDVYLGTALPLTYEHLQYLAFAVLLSLLGGRGLSTGHLMRTIRERDGLTYGIYASLMGFEDTSDGAFAIWATFAPSVFAKGIAGIKKECELFLAKPLKTEVLELKKEEMIGNYLVGLSTARGLASALHKIAREGKSLSYIEDYPNLIRSLTAKEVSSTKKFISLKLLSLAAAGTFAKP